MLNMPAELDQVTLGKFRKGADLRFLKNLEKFLKIAHEYVGVGSVSPSIGASHDAHALMRALVQLQIYDTCAKLHADGTSNRGPRLRKENGLGAAGGRYDLWAGQLYSRLRPPVPGPSVLG
jgi:hypothetical protein